MRFDNDPSEEQAKCMKCKLDELKLLNRKMMNGKVTNSVKFIPLNEFGIIIQAVIILYTVISKHGLMWVKLYAS